MQVHSVDAGNALSQVMHSPVALHDLEHYLHIIIKHLLPAKCDMNITLIIMCA